MKLASSSEFGFWEHSKLICWVDKTECGSIPPWVEESSFLSSSSFSSKPDDPRLRFNLAEAFVFSSVEISSFTVFFSTPKIKSKQAQAVGNQHTCTWQIANWVQVYHTASQRKNQQSRVGKISLIHWASFLFRVFHGWMTRRDSVQM